MFEWTFPISPIAASRPRVSRRGAYFTGPYKIFRKSMIDLVPEVLGPGFFPYSGPLSVDIEIFVTQPKKTKLDAPRADIDNYLKAILDSMNGKLWEDDKQIHKIYAAKQWAPYEEDGWFTLGLSEI